MDVDRDRRQAQLARGLGAALGIPQRHAAVFEANPFDGSQNSALLDGGQEVSFQIGNT
ncbi:hypothetical protein BH11ACT7_BH11ACT7_32100 [soil metagenome]